MSSIDELMASAVFRFATPAGPAGVWAALTCPATTARFLYGLGVESAWTPGAPLRAGRDVAGTVLFAERPARLTYAFENPSGGVTYVAWTVRPTAAGSVVRLRVSEPGGTEDDLEDAWLPVIGALAEVLAAPADTASAS